MIDTDVVNEQLVRDYLAALEAGAVGEALERFFTPDAVQHEFPNRLNPTGQESDLASILERADRGRHLLSSQRYSIRSVMVRGDSVAAEADWVGVLAGPAGDLGAGAELRAHFAMFFELEQGRIRRQRNYDCFEAW